jgi:hypothetical protein
MKIWILPEQFRKSLINTPASAYIYQRDSRVVISQYTRAFLIEKKFMSEGDFFNAKTETLKPKDLADLRKRLHVPFQSYLQEAPPKKSLDEILLWLWSNPRVSFEYLGRSLEKAAENEKLLQESEVFFHDIVGGQRCYYWRKRDINFRLTEEPLDQWLGSVKNWFQDPEARVVLAVGGGGLRLFGVPTVLKILDLMGLRSSIHEVWGSSGGSIVGFLYSQGVSPQDVEQMGYDFYNNRYPLNISGLSAGTLKTIIRQKLKNLKNFGKLGLFDIQESFFNAARKAQNSARIKSKLEPIEDILFMAISSTITGDPLVISDERYLQDYYPHNIYLGADPIEGIIASSCVPFVMEPYPLFKKGKRYLCIDGLITEEIPIRHPFEKWQLDRLYNKQKTPPKFKLFYLDLGARLNEIEYPSFIRNLNLHVGGDFRYLNTRFVDKMLDSRFENSLVFMRHRPDTEVIGLQLKLNRLAALDARQIPYIIQQSRLHFPEQLRQLNQELVIAQEQTLKRGA